MGRGLIAIILTLVLLVCGILVSCVDSDKGTPITIPDKTLRECIRRHLDKELGTKQITLETLSKLTKLAHTGTYPWTQDWFFSLASYV